MAYIVASVRALLGHERPSSSSAESWPCRLEDSGHRCLVNALPAIAIQPGEMISRISNPVPAATLESAYCDKLTALATRPYLKWRDIFDLWWIGTQTDARLDLLSVTRQFLHNVSAYRTINGLPPAQALRKFLANDPDELLKKADPDLRRWLPQAPWDKMHPRVTAEMVEYVRGALENVADAIEKNVTEGTTTPRSARRSQVQILSPRPIDFGPYRAHRSFHEAIMPTILRVSTVGK
jgi:Nucleotidyl transferase AbiEii toxin, Type IV TA system